MSLKLSCLRTDCRNFATIDSLHCHFFYYVDIWLYKPLHTLIRLESSRFKESTLLLPVLWFDSVRTNNWANQKRPATYMNSPLTLLLCAPPLPLL